MERDFIPFHIFCSCPLYGYLKVISSSTLSRIKTENITSVFIHKMCDKLKYILTVIKIFLTNPLEIYK